MVVSRPAASALSFVCTLALCFGLAACAQGPVQAQASTAASHAPSDAAIIVSAALRHYLERDSELASEPTGWLLVIDAGSDSEAVVACLPEFPVTTVEPIDIEPNAVRQRDRATGKKVALWHAEVIQPGSEAAVVIVQCLYGGRSGFQDRVLLKASGGQWLVVEAQNEWIA